MIDAHSGKSAKQKICDKTLIFSLFNGYTSNMIYTHCTSYILQKIISLQVVIQICQLLSIKHYIYMYIYIWSISYGADVE